MLSSVQFYRHNFNKEVTQCREDVIPGLEVLYVCTGTLSRNKSKSRKAAASLP